MTCGRTTGMPSRSAWNCISRLLTQAPPSTRSSVTGPVSLLIACSSAALWNAMLSSAARAMCATVVPRVMPTMAPRTSAFQYGAPRPVKAGTKTTPPASGTLSARPCTWPLAEMALSPSRSHCTTAPPMKTLPSSAYSGVLPGCAAAVVSSPLADCSKRPPVCISMKHPVP